jgi:hypothetical protein
MPGGMALDATTTIPALTSVANIIRLFGIIYTTSGVFPYDFN